MPKVEHAERTATAPSVMHDGLRDPNAVLNQEAVNGESGTPPMMNAADDDQSSPAVVTESAKRIEDALRQALKNVARDEAASANDSTGASGNGLETNGDPAERKASSDQYEVASNRPRVVAKMEHDESLYVVFRVPLANREQLTKRELEVILCIGEGLRNREIAVRLEISAATVAAHVRNIFRKLRVKTRTECARYVLTAV
jgi:DNA-binding NarL/FixJ family response regulator